MLLVLGVAGMVVRAAAQSVSGIVAFKYDRYTQAAAAAPTYSGSNYVFGFSLAEAVPDFPVPTAVISSGTFASAPRVSLDGRSVTASSSFTYSSRAALDQNVPNGTYRFQYPPGFDQTIELTGPDYLAAPQITNFNALQAVANDGPVSIQWNAGSGAKASDTIVLAVASQDGVVYYSTAGAGESGALSAGTTSGSVLIPPGVDAIGSVLILRPTAATRDNAFAGYGAVTYFPIKSTAPRDTTPPTVVSRSPALNATNVPNDAEIVLQFSEPMREQGMLAGLPLVNGRRQRVTWSDDRRTARVNPAQPLADGQVTLTFAADNNFAQTQAFTDLSGNAVPAGTVAASFFVGNRPVITAQPAPLTNAAPGETVTLTATVQTTGQTTLQWLRDGQPLAGATTATLRLPGAQPQDAGVYELVATNENGAVHSQRSLVEVMLANALPGPISIGIAPDYVTQRLLLAPTTSATLNVSAFSSSPVQIQWRRNGEPIAGATTSNLTLSGVTPADSAVYDAVVTNRYGSAASAPREVVVTNEIPLPDFRASYSAAQVAPGGSYILSGAGVSTTGLIRQWEFNGTPIPGATGASYTLQNFSAAKAGVYQQILSNGRDRLVLATFQTYSDTKAPVITTQPYASVAFMEDGDFGNIYTFATGEPPLAYQWYKDGVAVPGATTYQLSLKRNDPSQAGRYRCIVSNTYGSATTWDANVYYDPIRTAPPKPTLSASQTPQTAGDSLLINVDPNSAKNYQWYRDGVPIAGAVGRQLYVAKVTRSDAGTYTVAAINAYGSTLSAPLIVIVSGPADPPAFGTPFIPPPTNEGDPLYLHAAVRSALPVTCQWTHAGEVVGVTTSGNLTIGCAQPWHAGDYTVTATNANGTTTTVIGGIAVNAAPAITSGHLANISTRAHAGSGNDSIIAGFALSGPDRKHLLIRGVGPGLGRFGLADIAADAAITVYRDQTPLADNQDWTRQTGTGAIMAAARQIGAFPLAVDTSDAALLIDLDPGIYTVVFTGRQNAAGSDGAGLVEVYDLDPGYPRSRITNLSSRVQLASGEQTAIPGLVVAGDSPKRYLVRVVGPGLKQFGVARYAVDPRFVLVRSGSGDVMGNDDWQSGPTAGLVTDAGAKTGAFSLDNASKDAAMVVTLAPGNYTALVSDRGGTPGVALIEVYELP